MNPASSVLQSATYGILLCESEPVMIGPAPKQAKVQTGVSEGSANAIERHSVNFSHCQNFLISSLWSEWRWSHDHGITFTMCGLIFLKHFLQKSYSKSGSRLVYKTYNHEAISRWSSGCLSTAFAKLMFSPHVPEHCWGLWAERDRRWRVLCLEGPSEFVAKRLVCVCGFFFFLWEENGHGRRLKLD